jgi:hypothetical protein
MTGIEARLIVLVLLEILRPLFSRSSNPDKLILRTAHQLSAASHAAILVRRWILVEAPRRWRWAIYYRASV